MLLGAFVLWLGKIFNEFGITWENIKKGTVAFFTGIGENIVLFFKGVIDNIKNFFSLIQNILLAVPTFFINLGIKIGDGIKIQFNKTIEFITNFANGFVDKFNWVKDRVSEIIDKIKNFFNFEWKLPSIKLPHISWTTVGGKEATGVIKSILETLNLPTTIPKLKVDWYAQGGFPKKGDLFVANEEAPEMIGKMGNRNVVANNRQITEGIAQAVYTALKNADFGDSGDTYVYVGNEQVADVVTKKQKRNKSKYGL